jgi:hypothetical protein
MAENNLLRSPFVRIAASLVSEREAEPLTKDRYIESLIAALFSSRHTYRVFLEISHRNDISNNFRIFFRKKARDEKNHELLSILDLNDTGYKIQDAIALAKKSGTLRKSIKLTRCLRQVAKSDKPVLAISYAYLLEFSALGRKQEFFDAVKNLFGNRFTGIRTFSVHSSLGLDEKHFSELDRFLCACDPKQKSTVVDGLFLFGDILYE